MKKPRTSFRLSIWNPPRIRKYISRPKISYSFKTKRKKKKTKNRYFDCEDGIKNEPERFELLWQFFAGKKSISPKTMIVTNFFNDFRSKLCCKLNAIEEFPIHWLILELLEFKRFQIWRNLQFWWKSTSRRIRERNVRNGMVFPSEGSISDKRMFRAMKKASDGWSNCMKRVVYASYLRNGIRYEQRSALTG